MIYVFDPILKTLVWGTELWVLSGVAGSESICSAVSGVRQEEVAVATHSLVGRSLNEIYGAEFPLLIKFIDAKKDLSIQVHPDDTLAAARHNCKGKTEMWYLIDTAPGAQLLVGFKQRIGPEDYVRLVKENRITEVLARHDVKPGDVFYLPAGRVHAICGGCYLAEIQETSDITYRIYDYNRPGLDGKPRQLHTELAKDAIDYKVYPDYRTHYSPARNEEVELVRDPHFVTSLYEIDKPQIIPVPRTAGQSGEKNFLILIGLEGEISVSAGCTDSACKGAQSQIVRAGSSVLAMDEKSVGISPLGGSARFLAVHL